MLQTYSYNHQDETFNNIIDLAKDLTVRTFENNKGESFNEDLKTLNTSIMKYCLEGTRFASKYEENVLEAAKNPAVHKDIQFKQNFNCILAEFMNVVIPTCASTKYTDLFAEVVQIGFGDTARFTVSSNELFKVNEIAEGINRGALQHVYNDEFTVNCIPVEIATSCNWYQIAAGVYNWADLGIRAAKSFESYIFLKVVAAMVSATADLGSGYQAIGMSSINWDNLAQRVRAANGTDAVYAVGTISALGKVLPENNYLQIGLGEDWAKDGKLASYHTVPLIAYSNALKPMTINTTADLALSEDDIYMVAADAYKPVKVVFEGNDVVIEEEPTKTPDRTYGFKVEMRLGISAIVGSVFGKLLV